MTNSEPGLQCQVWSLERYARLNGTSKGTGIISSDWEYFDVNDGKLELTLVSTEQLLIHQGRKQLFKINPLPIEAIYTEQLLIHQGRKQLESILLSDSSATMKGVNKGDSLMIIWKLNNQSRRFRMKFSATGELSGDMRSKQCVDSLAKYFPVKVAGQLVSGQEQSQASGTPAGTPISGQNLSGEVTLGQLAEVIMKPGPTCLPSVYKTLSSYADSVDLNTAIKLCLTDPTFPAFVGRVEAELEKIKSENSQ